MALHNPGPTVLVIVNELGHITFSIAQIGQPLGTFSHCVSLHFRLERSCSYFKNIVEKLLRSIWPVNFLSRFQQIERQLMAVGLKKIMAAPGQSIDHLRATHLLRATPSIQITVPLKGETMLLDAHVAHLHFLHQLVDGHSPGALERVNNFKSLSTANFRD